MDGLVCAKQKRNCQKINTAREPATEIQVKPMNGEHTHEESEERNVWDGGRRTGGKTMKQK